MWSNDCWPEMERKARWGTAALPPGIDGSVSLAGDPAAAAF